MKPPAFGYARPDSLPAALAAMKQGGGQVRPLAGGQSLMPMLNLRLSRPGTVMDLSLLADMRGVIRRDDTVDVGALTTHAELEDGLLDDVADGYVTRVASGIAYRAIRNHGTVAGSLAHADPAADWPVALSALDARVLVANAAGQRELSLGEFFIAPFTTALDDGDLIQRIRIPHRSGRTRWAYVKQARKTGEFAESIVAAVVDADAGFARIVVGGLGGTPLVLARHADHPLLNRSGEAIPSLSTLTGLLEELAGPGDPIRLRIHAATLAEALEALA